MDSSNLVSHNKVTFNLLNKVKANGDNRASKVRVNGDNKVSKGKEDSGGSKGKEGKARVSGDNRASKVKANGDSKVSKGKEDRVNGDSKGSRDNTVNQTSQTNTDKDTANKVNDKLTKAITNRAVATDHKEATVPKIPNKEVAGTNPTKETTPTSRVTGEVG